MNYKLGQRVRYSAWVVKRKGGAATKWARIGPFTVVLTGIIVGKRTVAEGETTYWDDAGYEFKASKHISVYLVAPNLSRYVHVLPEDLTLVEEGE